MTTTTSTTTSTTRRFICDLESYEVFIGGLTPQEFVKGYESASSAVKDFLDNFPYEEEIPNWLQASLIRYVESQLEIEDEI